MKRLLSMLIGGSALFLVGAGCASSAPATSPQAPVSQVPITAHQAPAASVVPAPAPASPPSGQQPSQAPAPTSPSKKSFTVSANDNSASLTTITVNKGDLVTFTFNVDAEDTYHGGLDFRSPNVSTGTISPGGSKTISFTADSSFTFTPYWPASNIRKSYTIDVVVK